MNRLNTRSVFQFPITPNNYHSVYPYNFFYEIIYQSHRRITQILQQDLIGFNTQDVIHEYKPLFDALHNKDPLFIYKQEQDSNKKPTQNG